MNAGFVSGLLALGMSFLFSGHRVRTQYRQDNTPGRHPGVLVEYDAAINTSVKRRCARPRYELPVYGFLGNVVR